MTPLLRQAGALSVPVGHPVRHMPSAVGLKDCSQPDLLYFKGWRLAVSGWWLVVGGGWMVVGGWWGLAVGGWRLAVVGSGWRLAVGGTWRLVVPGGLSSRAVLKKKSLTS